MHIKTLEWNNSKKQSGGFLSVHDHHVFICVEDDYYSGFLTKEQIIELRDTLNSLELD